LEQVWLVLVERPAAIMVDSAPLEIPDLPGLQEAPDHPISRPSNSGN
jgi:hypothetical protein